MSNSNVDLIGHQGWDMLSLFRSAEYLAQPLKLFPGRGDSNFLERVPDTVVSFRPCTVLAYNGNVDSLLLSTTTSLIGANTTIPALIPTLVLECPCQSNVTGHVYVKSLVEIGYRWRIMKLRMDRIKITGEWNKNSPAHQAPPWCGTLGMALSVVTVEAVCLSATATLTAYRVRIQTVSVMLAKKS